jgi:molybdate transport system substrate-binding protein
MSTKQSPGTAKGPSWGIGWEIRLRVWVEQAGRSVLGPEQLAVLEAIDHHHSISAAARGMGIPFRRTWELVRGMNEAAEEPLVMTSTGGAHGGGAHLTPLGRWAMAHFRELQGDLQRAASNLFPQIIERGAALHVVAAVSLEEVLGQLLTDFATVEPDLRVRTVFGASNLLADHLLAGAPGQLFLSADPLQFDRLETAGLVLRDETVSLAENGLAAVAASDSACGVRKAADLAGREGMCIALAEPDCPLGRYTRAYLAERNLYERVLQRAVQVENSRAVMAAVRAGQADLGVVYSSDAARAEGCRTLFRVARTRIPIQYCGGIVYRGSDPGPARRLLGFLASSRAAQRFHRCGFFSPRPST